MFYMQHIYQVWLLQQLSEQKKLPTDLSIGLETYSDAKALPVANRCSLSNLCATATSPCISHCCTPLCATLHCATHLCLSHCYNLLALHCHGIPCIVALFATLSASISTQSISSTTPHRGSCSKVKSKRLGTSRILPLLLGTNTPHHPTSYLEVWLHVIRQPTWLEFYPYWRSMHE